MSFEDYQGPINLDKEVDALSDERVEICVKRAMRRVELDPGIELDPDDIPGIDHEEFVIAFADELKKMVVQDYLDSYIEKGLVEPNGVNEDGHVLYRLTDRGREAMAGLDEEA